MTPRWLRRLRARVKYRNNPDEVRREIEVHRTLAMEEARRDGMPPRESRWHAARLLGNDTIAREDARALWIPRLWQQASQDVRYTMRGIRRDWRFAVATVALLSIGLGVTIGGLVFVNGLFLRGWNVPRSGDVFRVDVDLPPSEGRILDGLSIAAFDNLSARATLADYAASGSVYVRIGADKDQRSSGSVPVGLYVSDTFFQTIGVPLAMGRPPRIDEGVPGVVISDGIWQSIFGADPRVVGRTVFLDGHAARVNGVTARGFAGLDRVYGVYAPIAAVVELAGRGSIRDAMTDRDACCVLVAGRARPGADRRAIATEAGSLTSRYRASIGREPLSLSLGDTSLARSMMSRGALAQILALVGAGGFALVVLTCANVGNLFLARTLRREREVATRLALGAGRARVIRQLTTEGLTLAAIAGALTFAIAVAVPFLTPNADLPPSLLSPDWRVGAAAVVAVLLVALAVSLAPAVRVTRDARRRSARPPAGALRTVLLGLQIAIATALILSATLISRGIQHSVTALADFAVHTTTTATIAWPEGRRPSGERLTAFLANLRTAVAASGTPVGFITTIPASRRAGFNNSVQTPGTNVEYPTTIFEMSAAAARVLDLRLVQGRWAADEPAALEAVINETLAAKIAGGGSAIGRELYTGFTKRTYRVVGVVADSHVLGTGDVPATLHLPAAGPLMVTARTPAAEAAVSRIVAAIAPEARVDFTPIDEAARGAVGAAMGSAAVAGSLGGVALVLAMIGVYSVFGYVIEERRREIGIRLALGADRRQVRTAMFGATRAALIGGVTGGLALSLLASAALRSFLFGLSPIDPASYLTVAAILLLTAAAATAGPIRRAVRLDPATTLRAD